MNHSVVALLSHHCRALVARPCRTTIGNSLALALSSDPPSLLVGSSLGLQERALEWLGKQNAAIRNIQLHVKIWCIRLCVLASGPYPSSLCQVWGTGTQL